MEYKIGQLVKIIDAPDQPRWIRDYIGKIALIVDKSMIHTTYMSIRYKVLIEEKVYEVHPLDLQPINLNLL
jgi:hypothetical protein